jgi:prepilin-type N-terminal cleavage/methylation domain-containing protein
MKRRGFTLIEIVIVLAIAALIMIIVFAAVQGAQRSRRDAERRRALDSIAGQIENYASNNNGKYPMSNASWNTFVTDYVSSGKDYIDPGSGNKYEYADEIAKYDDLPKCFSSFKGTSGQAGSVVYAPKLDGKGYQLKMCLEVGDYKKN